MPLSRRRRRTGLPLRLQHPDVAVQPTGRQSPLFGQLPRAYPLVYGPDFRFGILLKFADVGVQCSARGEDVVWMGGVARGRDDVLRFVGVIGAVAVGGSGRGDAG